MLLGSKWSQASGRVCGMWSTWSVENGALVVYISYACMRHVYSILLRYVFAMNFVFQQTDIQH